MFWKKMEDLDWTGSGVEVFDWRSPFLWGLPQAPSLVPLLVVWVHLYTSIAAIDFVIITISAPGLMVQLPRILCI